MYCTGVAITNPCHDKRTELRKIVFKQERTNLHQEEWAKTPVKYCKKGRLTQVFDSSSSDATVVAGKCKVFFTSIQFNDFSK